MAVLIGLLPIHPSVCPIIRVPNSKTKKNIENPKLLRTFRRPEVTNRCANFHFKTSKVKVIGRLTCSENYASKCLVAAVGSRAGRPALAPTAHWAVCSGSVHPPATAQTAAYAGTRRADIFAFLKHFSQHSN